jgi:hypothetical protein
VNVLSSFTRVEILNPRKLAAVRHRCRSFADATLKQTRAFTFAAISRSDIFLFFIAK